MNTLVTGLQYGDEAKARVSAFFEKNFDWYIRFNGGCNAGHTVYSNNKKYALHHLPSGAVLGKKIALDSGMVIDLTKLKKEWESIMADGFRSQIFISENAHIITHKHLYKDKDGSGIGSTKSGIAYTYSDKVLRTGFRIKDECKKKDSLLKSMNVKVYSGPSPCVINNEPAIYEGAQGIMLDIDYGHYPYVTSSSVFPSIINNITKKIGVMKAYTSRVGSGPPDYSEVSGLSEAGKEFGTTTGRRRRCTWLILKELEYAISILRPDEIVLTKIDVLDDFDSIGIWLDKDNCKMFNNIFEFVQFLISRFPQIKWLSDAPYGDLKRIEKWME